MIDVKELQRKLKQRSYERSLINSARRDQDVAFSVIKRRFARGKYDTEISIVKW